MLNVCHVHINDRSEFVTVEVDYMQDEDSVKDYEEFKVDVTGKELRYKILVKDMAIFKMLYNMGNGEILEVPFEEIRMAQGDLFVNKSGTEQIFIRVDHVPTCMIASKDKQKLNAVVAGQVEHHMNGFCNERYFERLPGYIDVSVLTGLEYADNGASRPTLLSAVHNISVPVCRLEPLNEMQRATYQSMVEAERANQYQEVHNSIDELTGLMTAYEASTG